MTVQAGELPGGKLPVELRGLDFNDPAGGEIRGSSTDDIACWFVGSDYNEESFFVLHAHFTRTVGRPFEAPGARRDHREGHQSLRG